MVLGNFDEVITLSGGISPCFGSLATSHGSELTLRFFRELIKGTVGSADVSLEALVIDHWLDYVSFNSTSVFPFWSCCSSILRLGSANGQKPIANKQV
jgi:hypothetical protein